MIRNKNLKYIYSDIKNISFVICKIVSYNTIQDTKSCKTINDTNCIVLNVKLHHTQHGYNCECTGS